MQDASATGGNFDFDMPADLFPGGDRTHRVGYRRFKSLAAAVAYCIERLPPMQMHGAAIETDDERYDLEQIQALYERDDFPLLHRQQDPDAGRNAIDQE
jgi:hypothetical protein